jgi:hypothetical protein
MGQQSATTGQWQYETGVSEAAIGELPYYPRARELVRH